MPGEGCYFAACERDVTYAEWGRMIGDALGSRRTWVLHVGPAIRWTVAGVATVLSVACGQPWYFNIDKAREAGVGSWTCSAEAAAHDLGIMVGAPLRDRIDQTAPSQFGRVPEYLWHLHAKAVDFGNLEMSPGIR
jgi:hypothetical protein